VRIGHPRRHEPAHSDPPVAADGPAAGTIEFEVDGRKQTAARGWYRGEHTNYNPAVANMRALDAVERHILSGWVPKEPFVGPETRVVAFGSCFATHIQTHLNARNYTVLTAGEASAHVVQIGEGIVNSYALRQQFDWAFRGTVPTTSLWHGYDAEDFGYGEDIRLSTLELFESADVFILTCGLSEVWYDEPTGEVFWRAVPARMYDPTRHRFRVSTVAENKHNIRAIYDTVRAFRPEARLVVTLSPIPLVATFRPESCIASNAVSKAVLRAAIDEVYRDVKDEGVLWYWPAYEIVQEAFGPGKYSDDRRHIKPPVLEYVMALFEKYFCFGSQPATSLPRTLLKARRRCGELEDEAWEAALRSDADAVVAFVEERLAADDAETAHLVATVAAERLPDAAEIRALVERSLAAEHRPASRPKSGHPEPAL
jgi:hypothetical protein